MPNLCSHKAKYNDDKIVSVHCLFQCKRKKWSYQHVHSCPDNKSSSHCLSTIERWGVPFVNRRYSCRNGFFSRSCHSNGLCRLRDLFFLLEWMKMITMTLWYEFWMKFGCLSRLKFSPCWKNNNSMRRSFVKIRIIFLFCKVSPLALTERKLAAYCGRLEL